MWSTALAAPERRGAEKAEPLVIDRRLAMVEHSLPADKMCS